MRTAFFETLFEMAERDPRIWLLCGDLGYSVVEPFAERFPDRFMNVGVAEQNMIGVAAGLAMAGKIPFTYTIGNFPIMRCFEQIRNDVCDHDVPVRIVAVGGGFAYESLGYTHHAIEDLAAMRALPGMTVLAPGDPAEVRALTAALIDLPGPAYLRLGKAGEPAVHAVEPKLEVGRAYVHSTGDDVTLLSTGGMLRTAMDVARTLGTGGTSAGVTSMHTVKPIDRAFLLAEATRTPLLVVVEEHSTVGGLGDAVARCLATESGGGARLACFGVDEHATKGVVGSQAWLRAHAGLSHDTLVDAIRAMVRPLNPKKTISIVTPCYNEAENVRACRDAVAELFALTLGDYDYEHIFADNASTDKTATILREMAGEDPRVRVILNARNVGPFRNTFNALKSTRGDAVVLLLAADLQDPPELIADFVRHWEDGYFAVYGVRSEREEGFLIRTTRRLFYRVINTFSDCHIPPDAGEYQLVDRRVVEVLRGIDDHYPYIRGLVANCGFKSIGVSYTWRRRKHGKSKNRLYHLIDQALNGFVSTSNVPTRLALLAGFVLSGLSVLYSIVQLVINLLFADAPPGLPTLIVALFFFSGVQLFFTGLIGEYITAIHAQVRRGPGVIELDRINFDDAGGPPAASGYHGDQS